ncbi:transglutaminase domain-containing protein [Sedimentibacter sp. zth1]|uniref:transglutaminase-like domain-containing protein n=1 Tax=Sedimentibacter sp. zth1 TaxID=2816908 RepID=UPI001A92829F|nr:transglutaminase-like domain-containing protein [Sedimentibacter sp. zth1]QSX04995.1 transglutaminase domain-containing protein [Sedimentibacter sp. zth1]
MNNKQRTIKLCIFLIITICFTCCSCSNGTSSTEMRYTQDEYNIMENVQWCPYSDEYLVMLRSKYKLDSIILGCNTDFEKVQAITKWVSELWEHDGNNQPEKSDPIYILDQVIEKGKRYRCVEYSVVVYGCLNALGIPTRNVGLKTFDVETREYGAGHIVVEAYLKDYDKWVFIDGQFGIIPMKGDLPLNGVEFALSLGNLDKNLNLIRVGKSYSDMTDEAYYKWVYQYLYYFDVGFYKSDSNGNRVCTRVMLVPVGADKPTIFQIKYPLSIDIFTTSEKAFYPSIK